MPRATRPRPGAHPAVPALVAAFPLTVPILAGFLLTGITCGIFAVLLGLPWWMPTLMSVAIFAGSAEFIVASMLTGAFDPVSAFVTILIVNARHLFYGLSLLERFRAAGRKRPYLIYALCDETFSIEFSSRPPAGVDDGWFMFWISALNQAYWVVGCTAGALFGSALALEVKGVSFAMTALFVVIFMDQWLRDASHAGALAGLVASGASLALFGPDGFIVPALVIILVIITAARRWVEPAYAAAADGDAAGPGDSGEAENAAAPRDAAVISTSPAAGPGDAAVISAGPAGPAGPEGAPAATPAPAREHAAAAASTAPDRKREGRP